MKEAICLIGFMGSGKTTIGQEVAKELGYRWIDLDTYIQQQEKITIPDIFARYGETYFRKLEVKYLERVLDEEDVVISTGGGIIVSPENVKLLNAQQTFYLMWEFDTLFNRIEGDEARPLSTSYEEVYKRYKVRQGLYENASRAHIQCEGKSIVDIVTEVLEKVNVTYQRRKIND